jgi:hypothetical protein
MSCLRFPWPPVKPACPTCGDAGWFPSPNPDRPFDWIACPCCHQDCWSTIAVSDVAYPRVDDQDGGAR